MNQAVRASGCSRAQLGIYVILSAQYNADCIVHINVHRSDSAAVKFRGSVVTGSEKTHGPAWRLSHEDAGF